MRKCDSCGKVVVNEQDYMCPHCGAVTRKHCDHQKHLPDDKYNRANDYRTTASEHSSKTYDYEKAPRTDASQKFDINDLANIKNAEDAKRIAKKAFIEQDQNGRKKFKPLAIVLIVIFAVNIFGNLLDIADSAIDTAFDEIEEVVSMNSIDNLIEDNYGVSEIEDSLYDNYETIYDYTGSADVRSANYSSDEDCLEIHLSGIGLDELSVNATEDTGLSFGEMINSSFVVLYRISFITEDDFDVVFEDDTDSVYNYADEVLFKGDLSEDGVLKIYGIASKLDEYYETPYISISQITILSESDSGEDCYRGDLLLSTNTVKVKDYKECEFYDLKFDEDNIEYFEKIDLSDWDGFYLHDELSYNEIIEY